MKTKSKREEILISALIEIIHWLAASTKRPFSMILLLPSKFSYNGSLACRLEHVQYSLVEAYHGYSSVGKRDRSASYILDLIVHRTARTTE